MLRHFDGRLKSHGQEEGCCGGRARVGCKNDAVVTDGTLRGQSTLERRRSSSSSHRTLNCGAAVRVWGRDATGPHTAPQAGPGRAKIGFAVEGRQKTILPQPRQHQASQHRTSNLESAVRRLAPRIQGFRLTALKLGSLQEFSQHVRPVGRVQGPPHLQLPLCFRSRSPAQHNLRHWLTPTQERIGRIIEISRVAIH